MTLGLPERVLEGALSWIDQHLAYFDPFKDGELSGLCEIPLAELAILTLSALRCSDPLDGRSLSNCVDLLESTYHKPTYHQRPFREPETLVSHLIVAVALERAGRLSASSYQAAVQRLVSASTLTAPALPPHRMMELRHALDLACIKHTLPSYRDLYRRSLPAHRVNPIFLPKSEAYIVTHVIFYAADLGHRPPTGLDERESARLAKLVERLLGMCIAAGNWDLTAELILSASCLRKACAFVDLGWECIAAAQRTDGAVPGPRAHPASETDPTPLGPLDSDVATCYHTTLVSSLAALAFRNRPYLGTAAL